VNASPTPTEVTQRQTEILACADDPFYFVDRHCRIYDATRGEWVPFRLWGAQAAVLDALQQQRLNVILKARQLGMTWLCLAYALWRMIFRPSATILLFSKRADEATYLLGDERLRGMHARLPDWLRSSKVVLNSAMTWGLANGSIARAFPSTAGDSYTATWALVDEADLCPDLGQLMRSVKPTIDGGGQMVLLSLADKTRPESEFKRIYRAAKSKAAPWNPIFLPWHVRPDRDASWYEFQRSDILHRTGSLDDLYEQYPASDAEALMPRALDKRLAPDWLRQCYQERPSLQTLQPGAPALPGLEVYVPPVAGRKYALGADPAEGNPTSDDSALTVLDADTGEEVAALAGKYDPSVFGSHIASIAEWYNGASVLVERNNHGHAVLLWLRDNSRTDLLRDHDRKDGWNTTSKFKALLWAAAADAFRDGQTVLHSFATFVQLASIEGSTLRAPEGQHDDRAIGYALALQAIALGLGGDWNIYHLRLTPSFSPPSPPADLPQVRYFPPSCSWQPVPVIGGEKVIGCPDFRTQEEVGWFVVRLHERLGLKLRYDFPDVEEEKRAAIEAKVEKVIKERRLVTMPDMAASNVPT
jgi:hypothetical protein